MNIYQGITKIADLTSCSNLTVLYLYNNKIKSIEALDSAPHIQLLYLQNNRISRMSGLEKLKKLKKLYLTKNRIQVLEGLLENRVLEVMNKVNQIFNISQISIITRYSDGGKDKLEMAARYHVITIQSFL